MGLFKEHAAAAAFEKVAKQSQQIYPDACDYGYPFSYNNQPQIIKDLLFFVNDLKEPTFTIKREEAKDYVQSVIHIGWEVEDGIERGTEYTISFFRDTLGMKRSNHKECDCFISVDVKPYNKPYKA